MPSWLKLKKQTKPKETKDNNNNNSEMLKSSKKQTKGFKLSGYAVFMVVSLAIIGFLLASVVMKSMFKPKPKPIPMIPQPPMPAIIDNNTIDNKTTPPQDNATVNNTAPTGNTQQPVNNQDNNNRKRNDNKDNKQSRKLQSASSSTKDDIDTIFKKVASKKGGSISLTESKIPILPIPDNFSKPQTSAPVADKEKKEPELVKLIAWGYYVNNNKIYAMTNIGDLTVGDNLSVNEHVQNINSVAIQTNKRIILFK